MASLAERKTRPIPPETAGVSLDRLAVQCALGVIHVESRAGREVANHETAFYGRDFISIDQIRSVEQIEQIFSMADFMKQVVRGARVYKPLEGRSLAILFYEPSTRTFTSFKAAGMKLGLEVIDVHGMSAYSSAVKGEDLPDTIRSVAATTYASAIVLRHPEDQSAELAAKYSPVPIINGGSGTLEHPTQALLDIYTMKNRLQRPLERVVMVGDLLNGRTTKSLAKLLAITDPNAELVFVSPPELQAPAEFVASLQERGIRVTETQDLHTELAGADAVYMTRVQKERFKDPAAYERLKDHFILTPQMAAQMPEGSVIMHPLPRLKEIDRGVDNDPRCAYFEQMENGLYVRMALLHEILLGHQIHT